jgi:hypothetical protein
MTRDELRFSAVLKIFEFVCCGDQGLTSSFRLFVDKHSPKKINKIVCRIFPCVLLHHILDNGLGLYEMRVSYWRAREIGLILLRPGMNAHITLKIQDEAKIGFRKMSYDSLLCSM